MFKRIILGFILWISVLACIDKIEVPYDFKADILTIDGFVTDQGVPQVSIALSKSTGRSTYLSPIKKCNVEILVNGQSVKLTETAEGIYVAPATMRGVTGQTYQLKFTTAEGKKYESTIEKLTVVPAIEKIYDQFNQKGGLNATGTIVLNSTNDIYIDFQDPANEQNYYLWKTTLWERQDICITCVMGTYQVGRGCVQPRVIPDPPPPDYDYQCERRCWDVIYNTDVILQSDALINGKKSIGKRLIQVPFYKPTDGALIEVQQLSVTPNAYRYYDLLRQQAQTTGTLTDTPPAPLVGNVRNVDNPNEPVVGYFGAAGISKLRHWIDRSNQPTAIRAILLGREANLEPTTPFRPPLAPCELGPFRTPLQPQGWKGTY